MGRIVLVTGGARSGKSRFAEQYAASFGDSIAYIATAQVLDAEMQDRVTLHRNQRPAEWQTFEAAVAAEQAINKAAEFNAIIFDCLTIYTSNLLLNERSVDLELRRHNVLCQIDLVLQAATDNLAPVVFVTNEVGQGIVPDNALSREYRDLAGWVNQKVAAAAAEVYLVVCGVPVELKAIQAKLTSDLVSVG